MSSKAPPAWGSASRPSLAAGVSGLSAVGITSGLATLGAVIGGGMVAGIFVAGAPMALLGVGGYAFLDLRNKHLLREAKDALQGSPG